MRRWQKSSEKKFIVEPRWQWLDWKLISLTGREDREEDEWMNEAKEDDRVIKGMNLIKSQQNKSHEVSEYSSKYPKSSSEMTDKV